MAAPGNRSCAKTATCRDGKFLPIAFYTQRLSNYVQRMGNTSEKGSEQQLARGDTMLSQTHTFQSQDEVLRFQKHVLHFITRLDESNPDNAECLFLSNNRTVRRQMVTVQATSASTLEAFNSYLQSHSIEIAPEIADAV